MKPFPLFAILLSSISLNLSAQSDVENKLKLEMWTTPPPEFKTTEVPEKWKKESAVVLAVKREYIGDFSIRMNKFYVEKLNIHFRIKLLDKAAVEDYSDISFNDKSVSNNLFGRASTYRVIGIKVIKPNKSENIVDLSKAVKADDTSSKELKIPIPNLEPGDIIDYYVAFKDESQTEPDFGDEVILEGKYPIVSNTIVFSIPHQFNLFSTSFNGAPDFKSVRVKNDKIYTLKNEMQEKEPDLLWEYGYRTSPHVRYRVTNKTSKPDPEEFASTVLGNFNPNIADVGYMDDFIELNFKKKLPDTKRLVHELYYMLRNPIYKKVYFGMDQSDPLDAGYAPNMFFVLMDRYLKRKRIDYEILIASPRAYGPIANAVSYNVLDFMIKVNTTPPIYLSSPAPFSLPNEIKAGLEGMSTVSANGSKPLLPISTPNENITTTTFTTSLNPDDITKLQVKRNVIAKGHMKAAHQYAIFTNYDYLKEYDQPKYMAESSHTMGRVINDYKKEKTKFEQRMVQDYNDRDNRLKEDIEKQMETKVSDYKLSIRSIGMWDAKPYTEYDDEFNLENMTKKAGPNTILELCKLIEQQTNIKDEQKNRTRDVYMDYTRTFIQYINFTIPEGYTVEGLENLKKSVESDAGGFVSSAEVNGNLLSIKTKKYYNKNFYPAADWPKITSFLDAAVDFYNVKLLLKRS